MSHGLVLVGTFEGRHGVQDISPEQVALLNGVIISHGQRQIYAQDDRFKYILAPGVVRRGTELLRDLREFEEHRK